MAIDEARLMEFLNRFVGDLGATMAAGNIVVELRQLPASRRDAVQHRVRGAPLGAVGTRSRDHEVDRPRRR
jgi:hypothetical protein